MFLMLLRPADLNPDIKQYSLMSGARKFASRVRQRTRIPDEALKRRRGESETALAG